MRVPFGKQVRLTLALTNPSTGAPQNGTGVIVTVTAPDGTPSTPGVTNPSTGSYYSDVQSTQAGEWYARWSDSGANTLDEFEWSVAPAGEGPAWAPTLDQVAAHVPLRTIETGSLTGLPVNTFTALTLPTASQVDQFITEAVAMVISALGSDVAQALYAHAAAVAAMWAAAQVELAQHDEQRDMRRYDHLMAAYATGLVALAEANIELVGAAFGESLGAAFFPDPEAWGDRLPITS